MEHRGPADGGEGHLGQGNVVAISCSSYGGRGALARTTRYGPQLKPLTRLHPSRTGASVVRTIFAQPDAEPVRARRARAVEKLQPRFQDAAPMLGDAGDILPFTAFPKQ